ncbi:hypothetical protein MY3296_004421 [Beauveria thailandica]
MRRNSATIPLELSQMFPCQPNNSLDISILAGQGSGVPIRLSSLWLSGPQATQPSGAFRRNFLFGLLKAR